jgi:zinc transport system ATP-binding protein
MISTSATPSGPSDRSPDAAPAGPPDPAARAHAADPVVSIHDLHFSYGRHPVLEDVHLDIVAGDFVSIIGPNGGGKTTLLRLMLGLLPPHRGTVRVFGQSPAQVRRRIGYLPQYAVWDPDFPVTVMDVVLMGRLGQRPWGPYSADDRGAALEALADVELLEHRNRSLVTLSGGQRQRVFIARALACEPKLLLLDEPTASLDPAVQDDLYDLLGRLKKRMSVVLVSHDVSSVSQHVDKVICVNITVAQHPASAIKGELAKLFPSRAGMKLVHHNHHDRKD